MKKIRWSLIRWVDICSSKEEQEVLMCFNDWWRWSRVDLPKDIGTASTADWRHGLVSKSTGIAITKCLDSHVTRPTLALTTTIVNEGWLDSWSCSEGSYVQPESIKVKPWTNRAPYPSQMPMVPYFLDSNVPRFCLKICEPGGYPVPTGLSASEQTPVQNSSC